jgi:hypothetical protein
MGRRSAEPENRQNVQVVTALVRLELDAAADRHYRLPGDGSPSLIYVFGEDEQIGARAYTTDGRDLTPGSIHESLRLDFWAPEAVEIVLAGRPFAVWYGGIVGRGSVDAVDLGQP